MTPTAILPHLSQSLQNKDPGFLRIVLELWSAGESPDEDGAASGREALLRKIEALRESLRLLQVVSALPDDARLALEDLLHNQGKLPWAMFTRRYGAVRVMGAGRRDRERPHLSPTSPAEMLWYRALVGRDFLDTPDGPQEFAYIPGDVLDLLPGPSRDQPAPPGRAASPSERAFILPANDRILDHACTLLAALRMSLPLDSAEFTRAAWDPAKADAPSAHVLRALLIAAELIHPTTYIPLVEATRHFLELPRSRALALLARAWQHSTTFNELRLLQGLSFEGEWQNDPLRARDTILELLKRLPRKTWWSLASFVAAIKHLQPDFQRPSGDYDSWFIRLQESGAYLRGFDHWEDVDGALLRFLICGPLHWLGMLDLAAPEEGLPPTAFRFSAWADALLNGAAPEGLEVEDETLLLSSDARLRTPRLAPRAARYQVARFCSWESASDEVYAYRLTAASLSRARQQGLRAGHLLSLLRRYALSMPPSLGRALERWEEHGGEARLQHALILRLRSPEMLQALRNSRAARFLGDALGPTAVLVKPGAAEKVLAALAEMGYMGEIEAE